MAIDKQDAQKLARLARIALTEQEEEQAVESINAVLTLLDELRQADVGDVDAMAYVQGMGRSLRCRPPQPQDGIDREQLLKNAPNSDGDYFLVPKVIE